ncbi:hypothetical protein B0H13DRAFT_1853952 [Mycena leptocephala]|nr:hypothetical protein B0H13DRAFT_1853952 [Mycena leptocephala]
MGSRVSTDFRSLSKLSPDRDNLNDFLPQPLSLLPSVFQSAIPTLGLYNGTIYDLLVPNEGVGNVTVNGTAFNITCRYITDVVLSPLQNATSWNVTWPGTFFKSVYFYTTIPVLDSSADRGLTYNVAPPLDNATSTIQIIGCSQSLFNQTAVVDSQSRKVLTLEPEFQKTISTWSPYTGPQDTWGHSESSTFDNATRNLFVTFWGTWCQLIPASDFPLVQFGAQKLSHADHVLDTCGRSSEVGHAELLVVDLPRKLNMPGCLPKILGFVSPDADGIACTLQRESDPRQASQCTGGYRGFLPGRRELFPYTSSSTGGQVYVWITTCMFYMFVFGRLVVHVVDLASIINPPPPPDEEHNINTISETVPDGFAGNPNISLFFNRPFLLAGNATVTVAAGLVISILLLFLTLPTSLHRGGGTAIEGTGILHPMWLYRIHPELETLLQQVDHPTDDNLRAAGMSRVVSNGKKIVFAERRKGRRLNHETAEIFSFTKWL